MKRYDVHTVREYVQRIAAESAREAKEIVEQDGSDDAQLVSGPDVIAVLEVTDGATL